MPAEERVILLREIRDKYPKGEHTDTSDLMSFAAGYVISRVGSGQRDLRLADTFDHDGPDVLAWAATIGGLGNLAAWTDAYNGLGRLISRELMRPFHIGDPPTADVAAEEVLVLVEAERASTRNRIRTGSRNLAALALMPGVVAYLPLPEEEREKARVGLSTPTAPVQSSLSLTYDSKLLRSLAEQLWPFLRPLMDSELGKRDKYRKKSKKTSDVNTPSLLRKND